MANSIKFTTVMAGTNIAVTATVKQIHCGMSESELRSMIADNQASFIYKADREHQFVTDLKGIVIATCEVTFEPIAIEMTNVTFVGE